MKLKEIDKGEWIMISKKDCEDLILIDRKDYQNLMDKAASNGVDTEILKAIYEWLIDKNQLTQKDKK